MNKKGETINWEQEEIDISAERLIDEEIDEELNLVMNAFIEKLGLNQKDLTEEHMKSLLKLSYATIMKEKSNDNDTEYLEYLNKELIPNTIKDLLGIDEGE